MRNISSGRIASVFAVVFVLTAALVALTGCGDGGSGQHETEGHVKATAGQEFEITLKSNPTTGYKWEIAEPPEDKIVEEVGSRYEADPESEGLEGAGGVEIWTFKAVEKGSAEIKMKYVSPENMTSEERVFVVTVD